MEAARAVGCAATAILARHIWPNLVRLVTAQFAVAISAAIFTSASLSFLGLGLSPPAPDWGSMTQGGFDYLSFNPWLCLGPGLAVSLTILGFYLLAASD